MIDIIVPTTFDPELTYELINSIYTHNMGEDYLITIVDNGSTPLFENTFGSKVKVLRFEERLWYSKAINIGINSTNGEYVLLLNNDTLIRQDNFLKNLVETINSVPNVGIVSPMTNYICTPQLRSSDENNIPNTIFELVGNIAGVCWLIKRCTINKIGLLDENFKNSYDDGDYCTRIIKSGYKIFGDGRTFLYHYGSKSINRIEDHLKNSYQNAEYYTKKWKSV